MAMPAGDLFETAALRDREIALFTARAAALAKRVPEIGLINAVDSVYQTAVAAGLPQTIGDDAVQQILSRAFAGLPRR
jgi:hypothetical protein